MKRLRVHVLVGKPPFTFMIESSVTIKRGGGTCISVPHTEQVELFPEKDCRQTWYMGESRKPLAMASLNEHIR